MKTLRTVNSMKRLDLSTPQDFLLLYNGYVTCYVKLLYYIYHRHLPLRRAYWHSLCIVSQMLDIQFSQRIPTLLRYPRSHAFRNAHPIFVKTTRSTLDASLMIAIVRCY